jgi:hypothetical protein
MNRITNKEDLIILWEHLQENKIRADLINSFSGGRTFNLLNSTYGSMGIEPLYNKTFIRRNAKYNLSKIKKL